MIAAGSSMPGGLIPLKGGMAGNPVIIMKALKIVKNNIYTVPRDGLNGAVGTPPVDRETGGLTGVGLLAGTLRSLGTGLPDKKKRVDNMCSNLYY